MNSKELGLCFALIFFLGGLNVWLLHLPLVPLLGLTIAILGWMVALRWAAAWSLMHLTIDYTTVLQVATEALSAAEADIRSLMTAAQRRIEK